VVLLCRFIVSISGSLVSDFFDFGVLYINSARRSSGNGEDLASGEILFADGGRGRYAMAVLSSEVLVLDDGRNQ